jgi:hypothetical protein
MTICKIYFLTYNNVFSQHLKPWSTLDVGKLIAFLAKKGIEARCIDYSSVFNIGNIEQSIFITSSSQNLVRKRYIEDVCHELVARGARVIPSIDMLKAHENKGFQVFLSERLGLKKPVEEYVLLGEGTFKVARQFVIKTIDGAGSNGVALIKNNVDLFKFYLINAIRFIGLKNLGKSFKQKLKRFIPLLSYSKEQDFYYSSTIACCKQELIEDLSFDYKVLVFHDKLYFLKRNIRKNDFRASGSNDFEFVDEVDHSLIEFCYESFLKLNEPYVSFDIAESGDEYFIIEFQGLHFGPYTALNNRFYYEHLNGKFSKKLNDEFILESVYADSLAKYIEFI